MSDIIYNNGHKISIELIERTLKDIGCVEIKDVGYNQRGRFEAPHPDFVCLYNNKKTAVEIGSLSAPSYNYKEEKDRLKDFFNKYDYIVHIYADKEVLLLHCIIYNKISLEPNYIEECKGFINKYIEESFEKLKEFNKDK